MRLRLKGSLFALARTEIPLFRALVAVVGAARAGRVCAGLGGNFRRRQCQALDRWLLKVSDSPSTV